MTEFVIPRGSAGTRIILRYMAERIRHSAFTVSTEPRRIDQVIRESWFYEDANGLNGILQNIRPGGMRGNCADAAIVAGSMLQAWRLAGNRLLFWLVALRAPDSQEFNHVAIMVSDEGGRFWIDPTAPRDADYSNWEDMTEVI